MVKGVCRQVVVVQSPDKKIFEQEIFILNDNARDITDEELLKEAKLAVRGHLRSNNSVKWYHYGPVWACGGAVATCLVWLISTFF